MTRYPLVFMAKLLLLSVVSMPALANPPLPKGSLEDIERRQLLSVGVIGDSTIWGHRNTNGDLTGIEVELAKDLANRLKVNLALVEVSPSNRVAILRDKRIDILLSSLSVTPERRRQMHLITPYYAQAGAALLTLKNSSIKTWDDLKHKTLCAIDNYAYNDAIIKQYSPNLIEYNNLIEALEALRTQKCVALLAETTDVQFALNNPQTPFKSPVPSQLPTPWAAALHPDDAQTQMALFLAKTIGEWHKSGLLVRLHQKYQAQPDDYLQKMHQLWQQKDVTGQDICQWNEQNQLPETCY